MGSLIFYLLNKDQADTLGKIEYLPNQWFSPYVLDFNDNYVVDSVMYEKLKNTDKFKMLDWSTIPTTDTFIPKDTYPIP